MNEVSLRRTSGGLIPTAILAISMGLGACTGSITAGDGDVDGVGASGQGGSSDRNNRSGGSGSGGAGNTAAGGQGPAACANASGDVGASQLRRLSDAQYRNTVQDLLGFALPADFKLQDEHLGPFAINSRFAIAALDVDKYRFAAETLAEEALNNLGNVLPCDAAEGKACAAQFIREFGRRAWRRPLTDGEQADLMTAYEAGEPDGFERGIDLVLQVLLQSPNLIYFVEPVGDSFAALDSYARATRLSYLLWNTTPDDVLLDAADNGELETVDQLRDQVTRMLNNERGLAMFRSFHSQWMGLPEMDKEPKSAEAYPAFTDALRAALDNESNRFVDHVFTDGPGTFDELLLAPYTFVDGELAALYDLGTPDADGRIEFTPESKRIGMLTQVGFLAAHAWPDNPSPIRRGLWIRRHVMCQNLAPPPGDVEFGGKEGGTRREQLATHSQSASCKGCHDMMDPIGFGLEAFDGIGRFRDTEAGKPVDDSGEFMNSDIDGTFVGPIEMAQRLAGSEGVQACYATQWFRYAVGRMEANEDLCSVNRAIQALKDNDGDVKEMIVSLVTSDAFGFANGGAQ